MELTTTDLKHLFVSWMEEAAIQAAIKNSRSALGLNQALDNLKKYKEPIQGPKDLLKILNIGDKRVEFLKKKLLQYCRVEGYNIPREFKTPDVAQRRDLYCSSQDSPLKEKQRPAKKTRKYVPAKRSGGYAILIVLAKYDRERHGLTKDEITSKAGPYCDKSFSSNPSTKAFYSAWNSNKTLISRGLVKGTGRPMHFYLTDEGLELADVLLRSEEGSDVVGGCKRPNDFINESDKRLKSNSGASEPVEGFSTWQSKDFEIVLVIDNREIRSKSERDFFYSKLTQLEITVDTRPLAVGDCLWIARNKTTRQEIVLDFILERKRLDDLISSIKDGRFFEQKARLSHTGMNHVYYLVEEQSSSDVGSFGESIKTGISTVIVGSKYFVKRCRDADDTVAFLHLLTKRIESYYYSKNIVALKVRNLKGQADYKIALQDLRKQYGHLECFFSFETFQTMLNKSSLVTVKELYVKMLMSTRGVSLDKALVIQKHFPTPKKLIQAYMELGDDEKQKKLLLKVATANEIGHKALGPKLSEKLYQSWGKLQYDG